MGTLEKRAPQTNATCVSDFKWMDNSLQQTPCLVAAYAMGACLNGGELGLLRYDILFFFAIVVYDHGFGGLLCAISTQGF